MRVPPKTQLSPRDEYMLSSSRSSLLSTELDDLETRIQRLLLRLELKTMITRLEASEEGE